MADAYDVTTVIGREEVRAGRIFRTRTSGSFEYDSDYLRRRDAFALSPALGLFPGAQALAPANPFSDSAPDTWGRKVQNRAAGRTLDELTLMLGVNDEGRQGATRFWQGGVAVATGGGVPAEADLSEIVHVADQIERGETEIDDAAVRRLFRATGSLGGARPKANVRIGADLWLAKFPKPTGDEWNVIAWEAAVLDVMGEVGIDVPPHDTKRITVDGTRRTVLFLRRFDRGADGVRIPYMSAMTALEATDGDGGDWVDVVDFAQVAGADVTELWRRAVFGALVGNLDDHLRNHGFLREGTAWALAPAFDVNPVPLGDGQRHQLALLGDRETSLDSFTTADALDMFGIRAPAARTFLERLRSALPGLPRRAAAHGADALTIETMRSRIEHAIAAVGQAMEP
ncbi:type II toxin-antitoxin system HipA family toxin [Clavibacter sp. CT19]|uniref:type II toxin-antitoxin system HipA family toxin n=1 Tax=unclassified Clavibacter TaxID=2626594 RepID=UPI0022EB772F|nr:HipA domain-containing protein [Clavibacter sp. CT19]MDA3804858.1 HipA domain-containing protein [Clavibacter sp. CT19]